jgi:hypothetical protein
MEYVDSSAETAIANLALIANFGTTELTHLKRTKG